jgi:alpha-acetolactate decarboxylase
MVASIPNDIFQFSNYTAVTRGFNAGQPRTADLTSHGSDGIGIYEDGNLMLLRDSIAYCIKNGKANIAPMDARLPFAMVTIFKPTYQVQIPSLALGNLDERLFKSALAHVWGPNTLMPFKVEAAFASIVLEGGEEHHDREGAIFGFVVPNWMESICGPRFHCYFVGKVNKDSDRFGGRVHGFEAKDVATLSFAKCGRFHLGFPQGEDWEKQELA